jgi:Bacterial membrane protein YfhO
MTPAGQLRNLTIQRTLAWTLAVVLASVLTLASLIATRTHPPLLIGSAVDAHAVTGFSLPSDHLGTRGRWSRGDALVTLPAYPAPAVVSLSVAAPDERVPDTIEVITNGRRVSRHALERGLNQIDVPVERPSPASGLTIRIRSAVTPVGDGPPRGVFLARVALETGGLANARRTPIAILLPMTLAFLGIVTFAALLTRAPSANDASAIGTPDIGMPDIDTPDIDTPDIDTSGLGPSDVSPSRINPSRINPSRVRPSSIDASRIGLRVLVGGAIVLAALAASIEFRTELLTRAGLVAALCWTAVAALIVADVSRVGSLFERGSAWRTTAAFSLFGLFLIALLMPDAWRKGYVLSQADMFFEAFHWRAHVPADYQAPFRAPLGDIPMMVYPFASFASSRWWHGVFPLWTNAMNAGQPFLGTFQSAVLSPFTLVSALIPLPHATVIVAALRLLVGGVGMFLFLRAIGLSRWAATFGGTAFLLNPFSQVWLEHPPGLVPPWLPWMLLAGERLATAARRGRAMAALALTTALVLTGGHPHTGLFVALLGGGYALMTALMTTSPGSTSRDRLRAAIAAMIAMLLGIGLTALQVLPFLEYLSLSYGYTWRNSFDTNPFVTPTTTLITGIVPNFLGHHSWGNFAGPTNYLEQQIYPGLATLVLGVVGWTCGLRRWRIWFFGIVAVLAMAVAYGAPGILQLVSSVPLLKSATLTRAAIVPIASLAVLGAFGIEEILRADRSRRMTWIATLAVIATTIAVIVTARMALRSREEFLVSRDLLAFASHWTWLTIGLITTTCTLALAVIWRVAGRSAGAAALIGVLALDLVVFGYGFRPLIPATQVFPVVPEVQAVRQDPGLFRVMGLGGSLVPNASMVYGMHDVRGYDGLMVARYAQLLEAVLKYEPGLQHFNAVNLVSPLIDLMNVKYVFGAPNIAVPEGWFTKLTDGEAPLYRNTRVFPRAFLVDGYVILDGNPARRALRDGRVDFHRVGILEQEPPAGERPVAAASAEAVGVATVASYTDHRVEIQTDASDRRLLVLSDVHYPGWTATIDGQPATVHRTNFAFRGVSVPGGRHTVTFEYRPASFRYGLTISTTALLAVIGLAIAGRRRK